MDHPGAKGKKMIGAPLSEDNLTLSGSFTSSSSYKPMLYLALAGLPFSFRTVNLKIGVQSTPEYLAINRWGPCRHCGTVDRPSCSRT